MIKSTALGIGLFMLTLGCQSAAPRVVDAGIDVKTETAITAERVAAASDHDIDEQAEKEAPRISLDEAKKLFDEADAVFVDTRAETFFQTEHIKGAINIPAADFESSYKNVPKNKKIIAYCS